MKLADRMKSLIVGAGKFVGMVIGLTLLVAVYATLGRLFWKVWQ